jgi:mannose-1-phosphate guanylyltransferase
MLPICGVPMIEWVVGHLATHGVEEVGLSLGYRPDDFLHAYPDGRIAGIPYRVAVEQSDSQLMNLASTTLFWC